jgi:hypothetical protein
MGWCSCVLEDHSFEHVGGVFSLVGSGLKHLVKFFELDEANGIFF